MVRSNRSNRSNRLLSLCSLLRVQQLLSDRARADRVAVSLQNLAEGTGLSKRAVQDAIARLHKRKLIGIKRESITAVPEYSVQRPWVRR